MSERITEFPIPRDRTVVVTRIPEPEEPFAVRWARKRDNETTFEVMCNLAERRLVRTWRYISADGAFVNVPDIDDLADWLYEFGGDLKVSRPFEGFRQYVLHTRSEALSDGSFLRVRVACSVPEDVVVHEDIRSKAVAA
ncbi:hypothetical protein ABZ883_14565 [Streptomyces sp. NPDC046977]|uniref:hypothetical protein n=1 Tax=Streptomyces sp. NPDC046977 TaxID=3154703 RepID=UPI0033CE84BB